MPHFPLVKQQRRKECKKTWFVRIINEIKCSEGNPFVLFSIVMVFNFAYYVASFTYFPPVLQVVIPHGVM